MFKPVKSFLQLVLTFENYYPGHRVLFLSLKGINFGLSNISLLFVQSLNLGNNNNNLRLTKQMLTIKSGGNFIS